MTTTEEFNMFPQANEFQANFDVRQRNSQRRVEGAVDECFFCGRGLKESALDNAYRVHLSTDGSLFPTGLEYFERNDSQGAFPVGSECAKRIPRGFKFKVN